MRLQKEAVQRVARQFEKADLGDPRRVRRLVSIAERLARHPGVTFPAAMGDAGALEGGYRALNNPRVSVAELFDVHAQATQAAAIRAGDVLAIHDTTTAQFAHGDPQALGYLPTGKAGFFIHVCLAVSVHGWRRPLGVAHVETYARKQRTSRGSRRRKVSGAETAKWTGRESDRWWRGMERAELHLKGCRSVIHVADRESDSYALMGRMMHMGYRFVFRVSHDRRAKEPDTKEWSTLRELGQTVDGIIERDVPLSARKSASAPRVNKGRPPRKMRLARLRFAAWPVEISRPRYLDHGVPETLRLNIVRVFEIDCPTGEPPVEWLLATTESIQTGEDISRVVDMYRTRWLIEEFNKALKTGCLYEEREFESRDALLRLLALCLPIACELLWVRSRARTDPDAPATDVLTASQLEVLSAMGPRKLSRAPTANEIFLSIAELGGHKRSNGEPGWQILHRGMTKLLTWVEAWQVARRGRRTCDES